MKTEITTPKAGKMVIRIQDAISVADLSQRLGVKASEIIKKLMALDIMSTVNQLIDFDSASLVAGEFGYEVESAGPDEDTLMDVVTDDGLKRVANFVEEGAGCNRDGPCRSRQDLSVGCCKEGRCGKRRGRGITQHIGAHHVSP